MLSIGVLLYAVTAYITVKSDGVVFPRCFVALTVSCPLLCAIRYLRIKTAIVFAIIPILAFAWTNVYSRITIPEGERSGVVYARVSSVTSQFNGKSLTLDEVRGDADVPGGSGIRIYVSDENDYRYGDIIRCDGKYVPVDTPEEIARGIKYDFTGKTAFSETDGRIIVSLRRGIADLCDKYFDEDVSSFIKAVTIADRSDIGAADSVIFSKAGASHVLAVSGLHLSVLVMLFYTLVKKIFENRYVRCVLGCFFVLCFCALAGFPYSVMRAGLMLALTFIATAISERADSFTSLFAALGIITVINPFAVVSVSLQLSFLATLGIISAVNSAELSFGKSFFARKATDIFITPLYTSLAVVIFTLPVVLYDFGKFSVFAPLSTFICILLFPLLLGASYLFFALAAIMPFAADALAFIPNIVAKAFLYCIRGIASIPIASSPFEPKLVPVICVICVFFAVAFLILRRGKRKVLFIISCCLVPLMLAAALLIPVFTRGECVYYCDVFGGYGAAVTGGESCIYLDSGSAYSATDTIYACGYSKCEKLVIVNIGASTPKLIRLFVKAYGTECVFLPKATDDKTKTLLKNAEDALIELGCDYVVYGDLRLDDGGVSICV
ncbi:MAG: ComEC/Rec2 family competence protein, partial [Clostridia bacterium]|nr:ComEC/Rec2 family competence protein [Clostridia bacterium]